MVGEYIGREGGREEKRVRGKEGGRQAKRERREG